MILDIIVLAVLLISAGIAFFRGFIREVLTILGVVGGAVAAYFGGPVFSPMVRGWIAPETAGTEEEAGKLFDLIPYDMAADLLAYSAVFIVVVILLSIASHLLSGWAKAIGLGAVDRTLGVIFGMARGVIIIALLYIPVKTVVGQETVEGWFKGSRTLVFVSPTADWLYALVPQSMKDKAVEQASDTADSVAESTREKLLEMDTLRDDMPARPDAAAPDAAPAEGYKDGQREEMNKLFEDTTND